MLSYFGFILQVYQIYQEMFSLEKYPLPPTQLPMHITANQLFIGDVTLSRKNCSEPRDFNLLVLREQKRTNSMQCVKMNRMSILVCLFIYHWILLEFHLWLIIM